MLKCYVVHSCILPTVSKMSCIPKRFTVVLLSHSTGRHKVFKESNLSGGALESGCVKLILSWTAEANDLPSWYFRELDAGIVRRTSHEEEFFNTSTKVGAVVREAIQNSIDAKQTGAETVMVRFYIGRTEEGVGDFLMPGLPEHLNAAGIAVDSQIGRAGIPFLAIEDFNTTGLVGDLDSSSRRAQQGDFYNFWWADGSLKKRGQSGGRWGLGKYTFFVSSKLKTFWGFTVRNDPLGKVLMGRSLLKPHNISDKLYNLDGFFVTSPDFKPILNGDEIDEFVRVFQLKRGDYPGLSIVVPMPFNEVDADSILRAVLEQYLFSIVGDKVRTNISELRNDGINSEIKLNQDSVLTLLRQKMLQEPDIYGHYFNLAKMYDRIQKSDLDFILDVHNPEEPEIDEKSFGDSINKLRNTYSDLESKDAIKLKVPVRVVDCANVPNDTYYEIVIAKSNDAPKKRVLCFRSGILVTEAINTDTEGLAVLLIAEDDMIAQFLGDAENPSHTKWSARSENFIGKYSNGKDLLTFITESPEKILRILKKEPETRDTHLLADIFYVEMEQNGPKPGPHPPPIPPIKKNPKVLEIGQVADGFSVNVKKPDTSPEGYNPKYPFTCKIEAAYVVRSGNPLKKYDSNDFVLSGSSIDLKLSGRGNILAIEDNSVTVEVGGPDFVLRARGFDKNRDLYVSATKIKTGGETVDDKEA